MGLSRWAKLSLWRAGSEKTLARSGVLLVDGWQADVAPIHINWLPIKIDRENITGKMD